VSDTTVKSVLDVVAKIAKLSSLSAILILYSLMVAPPLNSSVQDKPSVVGDLLL
jgi:hypothetical protein